MSARASYRITPSECTQSCAPRARIARKLVRQRRRRFTADELTKSAAATGTHRLLRRTDTFAGPFAKGVLHQSVLAGVIGNDRHHPARLEALAEPWKGPLQRSELLIHGDAERLKKASEVRRARPRPERATNRTHEIVADGERPIPSPPNDLPRQSMGAVLVAILAEDRRQRMLVEGVEKVRGGDAFGVRTPVHAHVERGVFTKSEAAARVVDLVGRNAKVEQ